MLIRLPEPKYEEAEAAETGAAPADATAAAQPSEGSAWEAAKATALAKAQAAAEQAEAAKPAVGLVEDAPAPAKEKPSPAAKARRMAAKAAKEQAAAQEPAQAETPQTGAADELVADQDLDAEATTTDAADAELGEPEATKPRSLLERIRLKAERDRKASEWEAQQRAYEERIQALERRIGTETSGLTEAQRLYRDGKVDDALERVFGEKFAKVQTRVLENKGAMNRAERELAELKAEREAEKAQARQRAEQEAAHRAQMEHQQAQEAELSEILEEAKASPFREIRGLANSPLVGREFAIMLKNSMNNPEFADRDTKWHYQVARNAWRELQSDLGKVFPSPAPSNVRDSSGPHPSTVREAPDQPGVSAAKPQTNSPQAEARGGRRRFSSEAEAWEAHTKALRIG